MIVTAVPQPAATRDAETDLTGRDGAPLARRPAVPDEWYERMAEAAASSGMAAEVSSAGWRKPAAEAYPAPALLARFRKRDVPITTASDAHELPDVAARAADLRVLLTDAGYESLAGYRARRRYALAL